MHTLIPATILLLAFLFLYLRPADAAKPPSLHTRTGAVISYEASFTRESIWFINPTHFKNRDFIEAFKKTLVDYAAPPAKHHVYEIRSEHLGTVAISMYYLQLEPGVVKTGKKGDKKDCTEAGKRVVKMNRRIWGRCKKGLAGYTPSDEGEPECMSMWRKLTEGEVFKYHFRRRRYAQSSQGRLPYNRQTIKAALDSTINSSVGKGTMWSGCLDIRRKCASKSLLKRHDPKKARIRKKKTRFAEMGFVSEPSPDFIKYSGDLSNHEGYYFFHDDAGTDVRVYIVDSGFDAKHKDVDRIRPISFLYPGPFPFDSSFSLKDTDYQNYHGTRSAAKISGSITGFAPSADLVIVNVNNALQTHQSIGFLFTFTDFLDSVVEIHDDVREWRRQTGSRRVAVLNMSLAVQTWGIGLPEAYRELMVEYTTYLIKQLKKIRVAVVTGAGNQKPQCPIATLPQMVADEPGTENLIVVGGIDMKNGKNAFQISRHTKIWAPATGISVPNITLAHNDGILDRYVKDGGTSLASASVAGVLSGIIGLGYPEPVKTLLEWAHPRVRGGHPIVWNGVSPGSWDIAVEEPEEYRLRVKH